MLNGLAEISDRLGIGEPGQDLNSKGAMVRHWLEADGERCLVVFDNVNDLDGVRPFVPAAGKSQVVITSTRQMASALARRVAVDVFTEDEALSFLHERTGNQDAEGARQLATELGWLPLALAHAGAVIAAQHLSYGTYHGRLRALPIREYLARSEGEPYPRGVAEAVLLSLDAVFAADGTGLCGAVMDMVSLLSAAGVPRALLYAAGHIGMLAESPEARIAVPPHVVDEVLGRLAGASLLTFSVDGATVSAHRLVMRVVRERLASSDGLPATAETIIELLDAISEPLNPVWQHRSATRDVVQQITALHEHTIPFLDTGSAVMEWLAVMRVWSLKCLVELGDNPAHAVEHGKSLVLDLERTLGPDHIYTQGSRGNLAAAYREAGRTAEAIPLLERTLADTERTLGPDHRDTLATRSQLAAAYREVGRTAEDMPLIERTLADVERILGPDHPDTLKTRGQLAVAYLQAGRTAEVIRLLEPALTDAERTLGPDSPTILTIRANLAAAYDQAGRTAEAITLLERALTDAERTLGPNHPHTLAIRSNLGAVRETAPFQGNLGVVREIAETITLLERTIADRERILGPDHPDTLATCNNLATAYQEAGRTGEAITLLERSLADVERILGPDHPDTLLIRSNLAVVYQEAGRTGEAIPLLERSLADRERILGPDHPDTLSARSNLAVAYRRARGIAEAIPLLERSLADRERILGPDHPDTRMTRNEVATGYEEAGRTAEAIPLLERTLADTERILGPDHPDTLNTRNNLALAYQKVGRTAEGITLLERTLTGSERILGPYHPDTITTQSNLAAISELAKPSRGQQSEDENKR